MKYWRKPLDHAHQAQAGRKRIIIPDRCKGCGFCTSFCPRGVLRLSSEFNKKGYHYPEVLDTVRCADCNFCEALCPEFAIYSESVGNQDENKKKEK